MAQKHNSSSQGGTPTKQPLGLSALAACAPIPTHPSRPLHLPLGPVGKFGLGSSLGDCHSPQPPGTTASASPALQLIQVMVWRNHEEQLPVHPSPFGRQGHTGHFPAFLHPRCFYVPSFFHPALRRGAGQAATPCPCCQQHPGASRLAAGRTGKQQRLISLVSPG